MQNMENKIIKDTKFDSFDKTNLTIQNIQSIFHFRKLPNVQATCFKSRCRNNSNFTVVHVMHEQYVIIT